MYKCIIASLLFISSYFTNGEELCGPLNGKAVYLQLGKRGNITHDHRISKYQTCGVELITCPTCIIRITIESLKIPNSCASDVFDRCPCQFVKIWEPLGPPWRFKKICNNSTLEFSSLTRSVAMLTNLHINRSSSFVLTYSTERNQNKITGLLGDSGQFNSPYFPAFYPLDIGIEHVFSCMTDNCIIQINFSDFLLGDSSIIEFYDWNGIRMHIFSGLTFRPPIIVSKGPSLVVKFYGNGGTSHGYNGYYTFVDKTEIENVTINTECGGEVTDFGGVIMMTNLIGRYDCYWIVRPTDIVPAMKTNLYLKIINFSTNGQLQVKSGLLSKSETISDVDTNERNKQFKEHIVAINVGFYVAIQGELDRTSRIVIVYTTFNYMDCVDTDFMCENKRCIPLQLSCDGFDNCGDNSDEPTTCTYDDTLRDYQRYYFPKLETYSDIRAATQMFIVCCVVLLVVVIGLTMAIFRIGVRTRHQNEFASHIRTISQLLNANPAEDTDDEPPVYEPPPEYSEVAKKPRPHRKHSSNILKKTDPDKSSEPQSLSLIITAVNERKIDFSLTLPSLDGPEHSRDSLNLNRRGIIHPKIVRSHSYDDTLQYPPRSRNVTCPCNYAEI